MPDSNCMVEQTGKVECQLEAIGCGRVLSGSIGCQSNQKKVKTEPQSAMHVEQEDKIKKVHLPFLYIVLYLFLYSP